jgi:hypothetical protein
MTGNVASGEHDLKYRLALETMPDGYVTASGKKSRNQKRGRKAPFNPPALRCRNYLILDSLNSTCLRATGSYFFLTSLSVMVREFFLAT